MKIMLLPCMTRIRKIGTLDPSLFTVKKMATTKTVETDMVVMVNLHTIVLEDRDGVMEDRDGVVKDLQVVEDRKVLNVMEEPLVVAVETPPSFFLLVLLHLHHDLVLYFKIIFLVIKDQQSPELVHQFYQDISKLGRPEENGVMSTTSTMQAINEKILSLDYGKLRADITTVDAQDSYNGGVFVLITGYLTGEDNLRRKFTRSFFLAPSDEGYFVLNNVFRYVDEPIHRTENQVVVNDVDGPLAPEHESSIVHENHVSEHATAMPDDIDKEEVYNAENVEVLVEEEETPVPVVVDEIPDDMQVVDESNSKSEVPKKSYASIVEVMKENAVPFSAPSPSPVRSAVQKYPEQHVTATPAPTPALISETLTSSGNVSKNENIQGAEVDGYSIYIKGLPVKTTVAVLENEFKKFGPIKSGGVQVKSQKGFCFGFAEFEVASAVQSAIEASSIQLWLRRRGLPIEGIIGEDFRLHGVMDTGMREQEGVEVMEGAEVMVVVVTLIAGLNLETRITIGDEWQTVEVKDIRGLKMVGV